MNKPIYRDDCAGHIADTKADCVSAFASERRVEAEEGAFILLARDAEHTWKEYSQYLTEKELEACWKKSFKTEAL